MLYAFMNLILLLSLSLSHTHVQTAFSLACIDFKIIFSFTTYSRQNIMTIGFEALVFSQSRRKFTNKCFSTEREHTNASQCLACHSVKPDFHPKLRILLMHKTGISHKTFAIKHSFHTMSQREQNRYFLINLHYK